MAGRKSLPKNKKLSTRALQELLRPHAYEAIQTAVKLMKSNNDNVRLGAVKLLLAKVLPDLKSTEHKGDITAIINHVIGLPAVKKLEVIQEAEVLKQPKTGLEAGEVDDTASKD